MSSDESIRAPKKERPDTVPLHVRRGPRPRSVEPVVPFLSRLYIWSVVLEPLAFFVLFDRTVSGVTGNLSRLLQATVIAAIGLTGLLKLASHDPWRTVRLPRLTGPLYINYLLYLLVVVVAGIVGIFSGAYDLPGGYVSSDSESGISRVLNSAAIRPLFEYLIAIYYFVYFAVLPQYLLRTRRQLEHFFSVFRKMFVASFVIGVIDLAFSPYGIVLVPRHISDWRTWLGVGARFHGLAGEPRHAFVYLMCGLAILHLDAVYRGRRLSRWWILSIIAAALATQSVSGMVGILCFLVLFGLYGLSRMSLRRLVRTVALLIVVSGLLVAGAMTSRRIMRYVSSSAGVWAALEKGERLPGGFAYQYNDIYPLYDLWLKARAGDLIPVMIGSGLGSAPLASSRLLAGVSEFSNPNSQFVRVVYEAGLIGLYLFTIAFVKPVNYLTRGLTPKMRRQFILFSLLVIGMTLGLRTSMAFIYLGVIIATFRVRGRTLEDWSNARPLPASPAMAA